MFTVPSIVLTASLAMQASAATITIMVGQGGNLAFTPNEVKAAMGDVVQFQFPAGGNHSVVEGDFNNACQPAAKGGFFLGYMNTFNGPGVSHPVPPVGTMNSEN
jgi:protein AFG1